MSAYCCSFHLKEMENEQKKSWQQKLRDGLLQFLLVLVIFASFTYIFYIFRPEVEVDLTNQNIAEQNYTLGKVEQVVDSIVTSSEYQTQELSIRINENSNQEQLVYSQYSYTKNNPSGKLEAGDQVIVSKQFLGNSSDPTYFVTDRYRIGGVLIIALIFIFFIIIFGGLKGINSLVGLLFSISVITLFIIPNIVAGYNVVMISIVAIVLIAFVSLYIAHGFNRRTTIALISTLLTAAISILLSFLSVQLTSLSGYSSEESVYLQAIPILKNLDIRGLLLAGIIIGTLGILDDITTAQVAVAEEISKANTSFSWQEIFWRSMNVGREHIASLVNTLALAYIGTSLPLFITFYIYQYEPLWVLLNREQIIQEVVRSLTGSIALLVAVPIATLLSSLYFSNLHKKTGSNKDTQIRAKDNFSFQLINK
jgi:uncharacterized membrane protein